MRLARWTLLLAAALALAAPYARAGGATDAPGEVRRIERLIDAVEKSTDHRFIRNGVDYDANTAARQFFQSQAPWYRRAATWWVVSAKKEETRLTRARTLVELSEKGALIPQFRRRRPAD